MDSNLQARTDSAGHEPVTMAVLDTSKLRRDEVVTSASLRARTVFRQTARSSMLRPGMPATRADVCAVRHESDKGVIPAFSLSLLDEGVNEWIALKPNAKRKRR